jgi:hypothetical protein
MWSAGARQSSHVRNPREPGALRSAFGDSCFDRVPAGSRVLPTQERLRLAVS